MDKKPLNLRITKNKVFDRINNVTYKDKIIDNTYEFISKVMHHMETGEWLLN